MHFLSGHFLEAVLLCTLLFDYKKKMNFLEKGKTFQSLPVPEGICIGSNLYGKCLIATRSYSKGSKLYVGRFIEIEDSDNYRFIQVGEEIFPISYVHSVQYSGPNNSSNKRQLYGFDGFMNHSCEPNTYSPAIEHTDCNFHYYDTVAVKDIHVGDEITTDYALFDYTCDGHEIQTCLCKSNFCRGFMRGFRYLSLEQKVDVLDRVDVDLIAQFLVDNPAVRIVDLSGSRLEDGVEWTAAAVGELVVTKELCQGSRLTEGPYIRLPLLALGDVDNGSGLASSQESIFVICKVGSSYKLVPQSQQCILNGSIIVGLFSFMKRMIESSEHTPTVECILSTTEVGGIQMCEVYAIQNLQPYESLLYV